MFMVDSVFYIIHICDKSLVSSSYPSPEVLGQSWIQFLQPLERHLSLLAVPNPGLSRPEFEPSARKLRFEAHGLPVRIDRPVKPMGIPVSLPEQKKRDKGGAADGARTLQDLGRPPGLPGQPLGFAQEVPG